MLMVFLDQLTDTAEWISSFPFLLQNGVFCITWSWSADYRELVLLLVGRGGWSVDPA